MVIFFFLDAMAGISDILILVKNFLFKVILVVLVNFLVGCFGLLLNLLNNFVDLVSFVAWLCWLHVVVYLIGIIIKTRLVFFFFFFV